MRLPQTRIVRARLYLGALLCGQLAAVDGAAPRQCVARRWSGRKVSRGRPARGVARAGGGRIRRSGRDRRSSIRLRLHERGERKNRQFRPQGVHGHRACAVPRREDRQAEVALRISGEVHDVVPGRSALHADCRWRQALHARRRRRSHLLQGRLGRHHLEEKSAEGIPHENRDVGLRQPSTDRRQEAHLPGRRRRNARRGARQERRLRDLAIVIIARARLFAADDHRSRRQTPTSPGPAERASAPSIPKQVREHWTVPYEATSGSIIMSPVRSAQYVFLGGFANKSLLVEMSGDGSSAKLVWRDKPQHGISPINVQPFVNEGVMYGFDQNGRLYAVELPSGKRLWDTTKPVSERPAANGTAFIVRQGDRGRPLLAVQRQRRPHHRPTLAQGLRGNRSCTSD